MDILDDMGVSKLSAKVFKLFVTVLCLFMHYKKKVIKPVIV